MTESELERLMSLEALTAEGGHQVCPPGQALQSASVAVSSVISVSSRLIALEVLPLFTVSACPADWLVVLVGKYKQ